MRFNILISILIVFLLLPMISADSPLSNCAFLQPIKVGQPFTFVQYCGNCTFVNVTTLTYPNGSVTNINYNLQFNGGDTYSNVSSVFTEQLGPYTYSTVGNPDGFIVSQCITRDVTATGNELSTSQGILYVVILVVAFVLMVICIFGGLTLPSENKKDQYTGYIIALENLKYLKIFSWCIAYLLLMLIFYFSYIITYSFLFMTFLANLFYFAFYTMVVVLIPAFPIFIYVLIANAIRDAKISEALGMGDRIRE